MRLPLGKRGLRLQWSLRATGRRAAAGESEGEGAEEGVDEVGEQGEAHRRGAPLAGTANSSLVDTSSGCSANSCGRVRELTN